MQTHTPTFNGLAVAAAARNRESLEKTKGQATAWRKYLGVLRGQISVTAEEGGRLLDDAGVTAERYAQHVHAMRQHAAARAKMASQADITAIIQRMGIADKKLRREIDVDAPARKDALVGSLAVIQAEETAAHRANADARAIMDPIENEFPDLFR